MLMSARMQWLSPHPRLRTDLIKNVIFKVAFSHFVPFKFQTETSIDTNARNGSAPN